MILLYEVNGHIYRSKETCSFKKTCCHLEYIHVRGSSFELFLIALWNPDYRVTLILDGIDV